MNYIFAPSKIMAAGIEKDIRKKVGVKETPFYLKDIIWDEGILEKKLKGKEIYFLLWTNVCR